MEESTLRAFVLMPFEPEFDAVYSEHIKRPLERAGYQVHRADSLMNQQNILKDIVRQIAKADLIVADLTTLNRNVLYELGIAHALRRSTVMVTQSIDDLPFDLKSYRVIRYSTRFDEIDQLSTSLNDIAEKARCNSILFGNPVTDFLSDANEPGSSLETTSPSSVKTEAHDAEEPEDEKGLWDYAMGGEAGLLKATEVLNSLTEAMSDVAEKMKKRTADVNALQEQGGSGSAAKMYRIVELSASEILDFARVVDSQLPGFRSAWDGFSENATALIRTSPLRTPEDKSSASQFRESVATLASQMSLGLTMLASLRDSQAQMTGISKSMNRASRKSTSSLEQLMAEFEKGLSSTSKVLDLLDETLGGN